MRWRRYPKRGLRLSRAGVSGVRAIAGEALVGALCRRADPRIGEVITERGLVHTKHWETEGNAWRAFLSACARFDLPRWPPHPPACSGEAGDAITPVAEARGVKSTQSLRSYQHARFGSALAFIE